MLRGHNTALTTITGGGFLRGRPQGHFTFVAVTAVAEAAFALSDGSLVLQVATMKGEVKRKYIQVEVFLSSVWRADVSENLT